MDFCAIPERSKNENCASARADARVGACIDASVDVRMPSVGACLLSARTNARTYRRIHVNVRGRTGADTRA
eukprot:6183904-Pleurochrysis_carterae.AAC.1